MNNIKRLLLGALSTLLLAAGFARAATHFDPISQEITGTPSQELRVADNCITRPTDTDPGDGDESGH